MNIVNSILEYQKEVLQQLSRIYSYAKGKAHTAMKEVNVAKEKADDGKKSVHFDTPKLEKVSQPAEWI